MSLAVTIAICTFNRARSLRRTLDSLTGLAVPRDLDWEVLVVDNRCTDETPTVLARYADALPLRVRAEPRQGLSHARNRALVEARGDYILWTDDDVIVEREWLAAYLEAFRRFPGAAVLGGPVALELEGCAPLWLLDLLEDDRFAAVFAHRDLGDEPITLDAGRHLVPYGANMVTRTREVRQHRFDPRLGLTGRDQIRGEEVAVITRLLEAGHEGRWVPAARVSHAIPPALQTRAHLRRYFAGAGRSSLRQASSRRRLQATRALLSAALAELRYRARSLARQSPRAVYPELRAAAFHWGRFREALW